LVDQHVPASLTDLHGAEASPGFVSSTLEASGGHMSTRKSRASCARDVALFRYSLIRPLADPVLTAAERRMLVRQLAAGVHVGPTGERVRVSRSAVARWTRAGRVGGFDALVPPARQVQPRTAADALELAARLKRERPARTAAHIARVIEAERGWAPSA